MIQLMVRMMAATRLHSSTSWAVLGEEKRRSESARVVVEGASARDLDGLLRCSENGISSSNHNTQFNVVAQPLVYDHGYASFGNRIGDWKDKLHRSDVATWQSHQAGSHCEAP